MLMHVAGSHSFRVLIPHKLIFDDIGDELDGLAVQSPELILLSRRLQAGEREAVLLHELQHAWEFFVPAPSDAEERSQLLATVAQQYRIDLELGGGIEAIADLQPSRVRLPFDSPATNRQAGEGVTYPRSGHKFCGGCETPTMCGSFEHGHVEYHEGLKEHQVLQWFRCESCGALNVWREVATSDGRPTGVLVPVPPPRVYYREAAAEWLAENAGALVQR